MRKRAFAFALALSVARAVSAAAQDAAPSFDCRRASTAAEKAICASPELSALDVALDGHYRGAKRAVKDGAVCIQQEQRDWTRGRDACGADATCLKARYLERIAVLSGLQPGAGSLKSESLPPVPSLVAAVPPQPDSAGAKAGRAIEYRGTLVHEAEDIMNMGLAIRTADGKAHVIILDMDLDGGPAHLAIDSAMRVAKGAMFLVKGFASEDGGLAMSRCRMLYRLP